jgi:serine/threonine protein kinase/tetratricopeptide (TPR) repeat protein
VAYYAAMDAVRMNSDDRRLLGRYTLLEKLGAGGYGEVWRAQDATLGIEIALKILSPALARSETAWTDLEHEHEVAGLLDHPSILKVYSPLRDANTAVLPMELAPGGDLRRLRGGSYLQIIPVLLEIAGALKYAHEQGVIHRDLKPGNVLFDAENRALLADFGVAGTNAGRDRPRSGLSPFSASPEQLRGEDPAISDDIYGLGALAYELLAGQPPYYPHFNVQRVLEEPVDELRPVQPTPPQLVAIVMRMLEKDPQRRPLSMGAVIDEIDATLNDTLHFEFDATPEPQRTPREKSARAPLPTSEASRIDRKRTTAPPKIVAPAVQPRPVQPPPTGVAPVIGGSRSPPQPARVVPTAERRAVTSPPLPTAASAVDRTPRETPLPTEVVPPLGPARKIQVEPLPWTFPNMIPASRLMKLEPMKARRWPWVVLVAFVAVVVGGFYALPHDPPDVMAMITNSTPVPFMQPQPATPPAATGETGEDTQAAARLTRARAAFDQQLTALEARGADGWGGREFTAAKRMSAEAIGAYEAGNPVFAEKRLAAAQEVLTAVEKRAPHELALQLASGERALAAGRTQVAKQAFESALRIDPTSRKARDALQRARNPDGASPVLADALEKGQQADPVRAVEDTSRTVAADPNVAEGTAGPTRERAAAAEDGYTKAIGAGAAALGAGRLAEARAAFERALSYNPNGHDAADGMVHVLTALRARGFEGTRQRASALEAQERWDEALNEYEAALSVDSTIGFAQQGKVRAAARALLAQRLQVLIDRPERLAAPEERRGALALIESANEQYPSGPVLRSQIARLQILLPEFDKLVHLALISDDATQIAIPSIGFRGTFSRRVIELKPGKYTVVGTRDGYRDVRRDITVSPGDDVQTISVSCGEPI